MGGPDPVQTAATAVFHRSASDALVHRPGDDGWRWWDRASDGHVMDSTASGVLVITSDDRLRAEVLRLAAAAGTDHRLEPDPATALRHWPAAALILVGADVVGGLAAAAPPRRDRVHLVGHAFGDHAFADALRCGAQGAVRLPDEEAVLLQLLLDAGDDAGTAALTVGVIGGAGGVGASTFAAALAATCADRTPTVLVDADRLGSGVDQILGLDPEAGVRWDALVTSTGRLSGRSVRAALPRHNALAVLAWPVERTAAPQRQPVREVLAALRRGASVVVADLARYGDPVSAEVLAHCDRVLVLTTTTVPAVAATLRTLSRLDGLDAGLDAALVLRTRPGGVGGDDLSRCLGRPVLAVMGDQRGLDEDVGLGAGPLRRARGPLARAATRVAEHLLAEASR